VRISRDGQRVAASVWSPENGGTGIWIFAANGPETRRLTFPPDADRRPVWSPDGMRLALGRSPTVGSGELVTLDLTGNGSPEGFVNESPGEHIIALPTDWSADGRFIALDDGIGAEQRSVWIADVAKRTLKVFLKNGFPQWGTAFSPDGKQIAFVSLESGRPEVYVQAFESTPAPHVAGERHQVSKDGAWLVRWRGDGRELFYLGMDNLLHAVPVQPPFAFGEPQPLFRIAGAPQYGTTRDFQFDVSPDGQRFILPTTGSVPPPPFTVIENWQEKFRR
jgi:Tol biopolymer transport system component